MPDGPVGRADELARGRVFVSEIASGARTLTLEGAAGIGKSTVWRAFVADARARDYLVLVAEPVAAESDLAYSVLADLLGKFVDDVGPLLPEPQRLALNVALLRTMPVQRRSDQRAVAAATLGVLRWLSQRAPVLLAVDDMQWADRESARILDFVARRLGPEQVGLMFARRTASPYAAPVANGSPPAHTHVEVGPLLDSDIATIVWRRIDRLGRHETRRVVSVAGGNPLYALELARVTQGAAGHIVIPPSLSGVVSERVQRLPAHTRSALLLCAAAGGSELHVLAEAAGRDVESMSSSLDIAERAKLIRTRPEVSFTHPLYAAAVYDAASAGQRRAAHLSLGRVVESEEARASHLAAAALRPDERLADQLEHAARTARRRGAGDSAARLLERAVALTPGHRVHARDRRRVLLGAAYLRVADFVFARRELEPLRDPGVSRETRVAALRILAELRYQQDDFAAAKALLVQVLELCGEDVDARCHAHLHLAFLSAAKPDVAATADHARRAMLLLESVREEGLRAQVLAVYVIATFMTGAGVDELRLAQSLREEDPGGHTSMVMRPTLIAGCVRLYQGRLAEAVELLELTRARALEHGLELEVTSVTLSLVWARVWRGELYAARAVADEGVEIAGRLAAASGEITGRAACAVAAAYRGSLATAYQQAALAARLAAGANYGNPGLWICWARLVAALQDGDLAPAVEAAEPFLDLLDGGPSDPVFVMFAADAAEALISMGHLARAERIVDALHDGAQRTGRAWVLVTSGRSRALLAAARRDLELAWLTIQETLRLCDGLELVLEVARTELVAGRIARRRRQRKVSATHLTEAVRIFERSGARGWLRIGRAELDRVAAARTRSAAELSASEARVAGLAAAGRRNREIAAELDISPKTVEATLVRVYAKLAIHSRAELGAHFARPIAPA